ncbi:MAG TPA: ammonium transporter [Microcoleaceae cyanobacterium]
MTVDPPHHRTRSRTKLILAFCLPLFLLGILGWLTGPMAGSAIAQDAAAAAKPATDPGDTAWMLMSSALVLFMTPGLAFFYGGLTRSRNVLNTMMMSLIAMAIVGVTWILWGYSLSFAPFALNPGGDPAYTANPFIGSLMWLGLNGVAFDAPDPVGYAGTIPHQVFMVYQMMFAIITVALVSGAIVERMSFKAFFWFVVLWSTFVYCPLAHMVWGKGFLGVNLGALDFAGGTVVHISSGVSALVAAWLLGPRKDWMIRPIVPHNVPYVLLGVGMLWFGWFGFNAGSALAANGLATVAFVATMVSTAAAGLAWTVVEWITKGKPTAVGIGSGFVAGLVGITPAAGFVTPLSAILIGVITSLCCFVAVNVKAKLRFDDSLDTYPIHGVGGTVGALLTGILATSTVNSAATNGLIMGEGGVKTFLGGLAAIVIAYLVAAIGTIIILKGLSLVMDLRVKPEVEEEGLDIYEHGEAAYGEEFEGEVSFAKVD